MATTGRVLDTDPKHYVWSFPGSPVKAHLTLQVVQRLKQRLEDIGPGSPESGLLFGSARDGVTEILDFEPASASVPQMVAALPAENKRSLVGYYRTEKSDTFHLTAEDRFLAEECFSSPGHLFLMIHPNPTGPATATFFFHDGNRRMVDFAFLEFPFDPFLLADEEHVRIQRSREVNIEKPIAVPSPENRLSVDGRHRRDHLLKVAGWTGCAALIFALGMMVNNGSLREGYLRISNTISNPTPVASASSSPAYPSMALHALRQNRDLELTWKGQSPLIAAATSGVVSIQDGDSKRQVSLDSAQLRGGSLLYSPLSDQILMQLTVATPSGAVTEAVTVILPKVGPPQTLPMPALKRPSTSVTSATAESQPVLLAQASKPFAAPSVPKSEPSAPPPVLQEPPALTIKPGAPAPLPGVMQGAQPSLPTLAAPPQQPGPSQQQPAASPQQLATRVITYEPAVPVVKTPPTLPQELRNMTIKPTIVQVKVAIDKNGRVTKAEAIPDRAVSAFLLNAAANAARLWRFQPARRDGQPESSELVLQFAFSH